MALINQNLYNEHKFYTLDSTTNVYRELKPTDTEMSANSDNPVSNGAIVSFVNSSIASYIYYLTKNSAGDQFATKAELLAATKFYHIGVERVPANNDYTIVTADEDHNNQYSKYVFMGKTSTTAGSWQYQYTYSSLTPTQLSAVNSGITSTKVSIYDDYSTTKQDTLVSGTNIKTINSNSLLGNGNIAVQAVITGGATTITSNDLTKSRALISNDSGKVAVSTVTSTELGYVSGVTSSIQTQINSKATTSSIDFLGAEAVCENGSSGTINLQAGRIFYTTASSITLPAVTKGVTITIITTATSVNWSGGARVWSGGSAPTLRTGSYQLFTFIGYGNYWFGVYGGPFS